MKTILPPLSKLQLVAALRDDQAISEKDRAELLRRRLDTQKATLLAESRMREVEQSYEGTRRKLEARRSAMMVGGS